MSPLRAKMVREMQLQRLAPETVRAYVDAVRGLARHFRCSPDRLNVEQVRTYLHHLLVERKLAASSCNQAACAFVFLYRKVLGWKDFDLSVRFRRSGRLPVVLSRQEVQRLLEAASNPKRRALLMTAYAAGLRVRELVNLKVTDIHSERQMIRVDQGKGNKDRYTLLSPSLLAELRSYWKCYRPPGPWLFPAMRMNKRMHRGTAQKFYSLTKQQAGLTRGHGIHTLRHCFATHLLEAGVDVRTIQTLLGHKNIKTTCLYLQVAQKHLGRLSSPFDLLYRPDSKQFSEE